MERLGHYLLAIHTKKGQIVPIDIRLLDSYDGEYSTKLEGIDAFTKKLSPDLLKEEITSVNLLSEEELEGEICIITIHNNSYIKIPSGPLFYNFTGAIDTESIFSSLNALASSGNAKLLKYKIVEIEHLQISESLFAFIAKYQALVSSNYPLTEILEDLNNLDYPDLRSLAIALNTLKFLVPTKKEPKQPPKKPNIIEKLILRLQPIFHRR